MSSFIVSEEVANFKIQTKYVFKPVPVLRRLSSQFLALAAVHLHGSRDFRDFLVKAAFNAETSSHVDPALYCLFAIVWP